MKKNCCGFIGRRLCDFGDHSANSGSGNQCQYHGRAVNCGGTVQISRRCVEEKLLALVRLVVYIRDCLSAGRHTRLQDQNNCANEVLTAIPVRGKIVTIVAGLSLQSINLQQQWPNRPAGVRTGRVAVIMDSVARYPYHLCS